jgi:UDP-2,4-diacetamido-2,4,6-trideoxy-beta-L-altropyranose hydrolase
MPAPLEAAIARAGHDFARLEVAAAWTVPKGAWPADVQAADALACLPALGGADWLVVDHYGLDAGFEQRVPVPVLAIDDLGRAHACALLHDPTPHADPDAFYAGTRAGERLIGPAFALLRPAFAAERARLKREPGPVRRLLVFMGGLDDRGATRRALAAIEAAGLRDRAVDVVVGSLHPERAEVAALIATHPDWTLHVDSPDMAVLMARADLALGAGGSATWERLALGLPTVAVAIAANQERILAEGARLGFLVRVDDSVEAMAAALAALAADTAARWAMTRRALDLCDGQGAIRIAARMAERGVEAA